VCRLVLSRYPEQHISVVTCASKHLSSWTPSHNIDSLGMLYESGEIGDLALVTVRLDVPEPNIVVSTCCCQSSLAMGLEVSRVYGGILVVPGHKQRSSLHDG